MIAGVVVLSLIPVEVDFGKDSDKVAHFLAYCSLTLWFGMIFLRRAPQLGIALAFCAMGVDRVPSGLDRYRTMDVAEHDCERTGAALGWGSPRRR
jgi:hypothetical protein